MLFRRIVKPLINSRMPRSRPHSGLEARPGDPRVGYDVVPFVRVLADGRFQKDELRQMLLDHGAEFQLGEIRLVQPDVVGLALHGLEVIERVDKHARHIAHVDIVALEMPLEDHHRPVGHRPMDEIIDQQVNPHPRRYAEDGRQAEADAVLALQDAFLRLHFRHAVERDWPERRFFRAVFALLADAVAAVGHRHDDALGLGGEAAEHRHGLEVGRPRGHGVAVAQGRPHQRRQRNDRRRPRRPASSSGLRPGNRPAPPGRSRNGSNRRGCFAGTGNCPPPSPHARAPAEWESAPIRYSRRRL